MKKRRLNKGLTQTRLAKMCGVSFGYIAHIEAGRSISKEMAQRIADALDCTLDKLFKPCRSARTTYEVK